MNQIIAARINKPNKWAVIDENKNIIEEFRTYGAARDMISHLKDVYVNKRLKIVQNINV